MGALKALPGKHQGHGGVRGEPMTTSRHGRYCDLCGEYAGTLRADEHLDVCPDCERYLIPQHPPVPDPEPEVDYCGGPIERPYCDECGSTLVVAPDCFMSRCKRNHLHCPNT